MAVTKDQVLEFLKNMSVIELADFVKELEDVKRVQQEYMNI